MTTVTLQPDIANQIAEIANQQHETIESLIDHALREYMANYRRAKIRSETEAFHQQQSSLVKNYLGQFVAIHNQQVIDHDPDLRTLHLRVHARLGRMPVLLKQVTVDSEPDLVFRSPKFEQSNS